MKRIFLLLCILSLLAGCARKSITSSIFSIEPAQTIRNEKCENDVSAIKIFQVVDDFALATTCEYGEYTNDLHCFGYTVYIPKEKGQLYFDGKVIKPKDGQCISYSGTYQYEAKNGSEKTVPKVKMIDAEVPNPEYKKWLKEQEKKEKEKKIEEVELKEGE